MQELQVFNYECSDKFTKEVRTVNINGEFFWVAKDVCDILDLSNTSEAMTRLDDDEKQTIRISDSGPESHIVNESGLYSLILRSNKPEAKKFKKWITSEVLPSIRKTGSYLAKNDLITTEIKSLYDKVDSMSKEIRSLKKMLSGKNIPQNLKEIMSFFNIIDYSPEKENIVVEYNNDLFLVNCENNFSVYRKQITEQGLWENNWRIVNFKLGSLKKGLEFILEMY
jgi:prophage antirepressor-like protein